jgi:hypothetical protein
VNSRLRVISDQLVRIEPVFSETVWIVKSPSPVKSIVIELYRNDCRGSVWDGSTCVIVNGVNVRVRIQ